MFDECMFASYCQRGCMFAWLRGCMLACRMIARECAAMAVPEASDKSVRGCGQERAERGRLWGTGEAGSVSRWLGHAGGRAMGSDELQRVAGGAARKDLRPGHVVVREGGRREGERERSGRARRNVSPTLTLTQILT